MMNNIAWLKFGLGNRNLQASCPGRQVASTFHMHRNCWDLVIKIEISIESALSLRRNKEKRQLHVPEFQ